jgi:hypothetical protein
MESTQWGATAGTNLCLGKFLPVATPLTGNVNNKLPVKFSPVASAFNLNFESSPVNTASDSLRPVLDDGPTPLWHRLGPCDSYLQQVVCDSASLLLPAVSCCQ